MADQDSESSTEIQAQTSEDSRPRFGAGLDADPSAPPSPAVGGPSEDADSATPSPQERDWDKIDLERVNPDELPEHLKPAKAIVQRLRADYTRKTQEIARQREQMRAEMEAERRQYLEALQRTQPQQAAEQQLDVLQRLAADPNLSAEERRGLEAVKQLIDSQVGQVAQESKALREELQQVRQAQQAILQERQAQAMRRVQGELEEANSAFGEETVNQYAPLIRANYGQVDPRTGEPFTISAMLELFTGRQATAIQQAREGQQAARLDAKAKLRPKAAPTSSEDRGGRLSRREAESQVAKIFG